jgi:DNA-binding GntR family transcriptional regulator
VARPARRAFFGLDAALTRHARKTKGPTVIRRVVLSEQVKEELLDDILSGRVKPGDRLVESQIAKRMGTSQSPVREALRDLVAMRFVEVEPHKGARVRLIQRREILEIYPVRAALEDLAGNLAVENGSDCCDELEESLMFMTRAFKARDARKMARWDTQFHRTIIEASGNQILIEAWNSLMIEARTFVTLSNLIASRPKIDLAARHRPIIDALRSGDPSKCGKVMHDHVVEFGDVMRRILGDETLSAVPGPASEAARDAVDASEPVAKLG